MEVCGACQKPITKDDEFIVGTTGYRGVLDQRKYHVACYNRERKKTLKWSLIIIGVGLVIAIIVMVVMIIMLK